jgi:hypothetical protein
MSGNLHFLPVQIRLQIPTPGSGMSDAIEASAKYGIRFSDLHAAE